MTALDRGYYLLGLIFLFLAKAKNVMWGYSTPKPFDTSEVERCIEYDAQVVDGWVSHLSRYLQTDQAATLVGKDVLELGPGSDLGTGVCLLARGIAAYNACDVNNLADAATGPLYEALCSRLQATDGRGPVDWLREEVLKARAHAHSRLNYVVRDDFDLVKAFGRDSIDIVFSQAAFEHFDDVDATVAGMTEVCRPGAVLVAEVDLKTHSRWIRDRDPNNIYRFQPAVYRWFWFRGAPNRLRPRDYVRSLERHGWIDISVTPLSRLRAERSQGLADAFRDAGNQMEVLTIALCARLP